MPKDKFRLEYHCMIHISYIPPKLVTLTREWILGCCRSINLVCKCEKQWRQQTIISERPVDPVTVFLEKNWDVLQSKRHKPEDEQTGNLWLQVCISNGVRLNMIGNRALHGLVERGLVCAELSNKS